MGGPQRVGPECYGPVWGRAGTIGVCVRALGATLADMGGPHGESCDDPPLSDKRDLLSGLLNIQNLYHWQPTDKTLTRTKYYGKQIHMWGFKYSQHLHNNLRLKLLYNCFLYFNRIVSNQFLQTLILSPLDHKPITKY